MFDFKALLSSFPIMGLGMLGIFIVIGVIMVVIFVLNRIFPEKKQSGDTKQ